MSTLTADWVQRVGKAIAGDRINKPIRHYYSDPVGFARDCVHWPATGGGFLTAYQQDILAQLGRPAGHGVTHRSRVAARGPHGLGKTALAALAILWFALTREARGVDWKVACTAGSWHQLTQYLFPEIHRWSARLDWDMVRDGRRFTRNELQNLNLRLEHGRCFAAASANAALIEGAHADSLMFVYDEAKAIPANTFDACEGAFSGTGEALALAISTPGPPQGRFYDIHARKPGYEDWAVRHVTLDEAIGAGRIEPGWAEQRAKQWGRESALFVNRVLGDFHAGDEDAVIPLAWVEQAVERWHAWVDEGRKEPAGPRVVGVDVARFGCFDDRTEILTDDGWKLFADVKGTESVLSLNGDIAEWAPIDQVHKYEFDGELNVYEARGASFAITDNHNLITRPPKSSGWSIRRFDEMPRYSCVRRSGDWEGRNPETVTFEQAVPMFHGGSRNRTWTFKFGDFCMFVGWFVAEGNVYHERRRNGRARIMLTQFPGEKANDIAALLARMGLRYRTTPNGHQFEVCCRPLADWLTEHCGAGAANKRIPRMIKDATRSMIRAFLDAYRSGDGWWNASGGCTYSTTSAKLVDDLQEVLAKLGVCGKATRAACAGSTSVVDGRTITRQFDTWQVIEYSRPQDIYLDKAKVRREAYQGFVYCVSTPHRTILVRRGGVVMWSGNSDRTVLAVRRGPVVEELRVSSKADTMATTGRVAGLLQGHPHALAVVDVIGIGAGVVDRLREQGHTVVAFNASHGTKRRDRVGELGFVNMRSAAWWQLRELLDPAMDPEVCLPPDEELLGDLTAPKWREVSGGKIAVESKDDIRLRIGRSTDYGDAVIQAFEVPSTVMSGREAVPWREHRGRGHAVAWGGQRDRAAVGWG